MLELLQKRFVHDRLRTFTVIERYHLELVCVCVCLTHVCECASMGEVLMLPVQLSSL